MTALPASVPQIPGASAGGTGAEVAVWVLVGLFGLAGSILCSGSEMGTYSVNRVRLRLRLSRSTDPAASLLAVELEHPARTLAVLLVGNNIFNALIGFAATALLTLAGFGEAGIVLMTALVLTPALFVLGDALPKEVFRARADVLMYSVVYLVSALRVVLTWSGVLFFVSGAARLVAGLFIGHRADDSGLERGRQRIVTLLKEGALRGGISEHQATLLDRAFNLREAQVGDEMVPWARVQTIRENASRAGVLSVLAASPHSRYPVINARGEVLGIADKIEICIRADTPVRDLIQPAIALAPQTPVREALSRLIRDGGRLAIIGTPSRPLGIVTLKDLVEPLTGELRAW
jgi:putative hemolysin